MEHAEGLPDNVKEVIAKQIGMLLPRIFDPELLSQAEVKLRETFEVWVLEADAVIQSTDDLSLLARPIGRWHHQVSIDSEVKSFARSTPLGATPESWRVVEVFQSPLAEKIDDALRRIDDLKLGDEWLARLLVVPAYQVHAFWLLNSEDVEKIFVIDHPAQFTHLLTDRLLSYDEFLVALRREQHIIGRLRS